MPRSLWSASRASTVFLSLWPHAQDVKIDPSNGIAFLPEAPHMQPPAKSAPTTSATHGAPWWIKQAIAGSASVTNDMEEAEVIFVYDLCYYQRWLGQVRSGGVHGHICALAGVLVL